MLGSYCNNCDNCRRRQLEALDVPILLDLGGPMDPDLFTRPETPVEPKIVANNHIQAEARHFSELVQTRTSCSADYATQIVTEAGRPEISAADALHLIDRLALRRAQQKSIGFKRDEHREAIETLALIGALEKGHEHSDNRTSRVTALGTSIEGIEALRDINGLAIRRMHARCTGIFRDEDADRDDALQFMRNLEDHHSVLGGKRADFVADPFEGAKPVAPEYEYGDVRQAAMENLKNIKSKTEKPVIVPGSAPSTLIDTDEMHKQSHALSSLNTYFETRCHSRPHTLDINTNTVESNDRDSSGSVRVKGPLTTDLLRKLMDELESPVETPRAPEGDDRSTTAEVLALLEEETIDNQVETPKNNPDVAYAAEQDHATLEPSVKRPSVSQFDISCAPLRLRRQKTKRFDLEQCSGPESRADSIVTQNDAGDSPDSRSPSDKSCASGTTTRTSHDFSTPLPRFQPFVVTSDKSSFQSSLMSLNLVPDDSRAPLRRLKPYVVTTDNASFQSSRVLTLNPEQVDSEPKRHSVAADIEVSTPDVFDTAFPKAGSPMVTEVKSEINMEERARSHDFDTDHACYDDSGNLDHALFSPVFDHIGLEGGGSEDISIDNQQGSFASNPTNMNRSMSAQHQPQIQMQEEMQSRMQDQIQEWMQFAQAQMTSQMENMQAEMQKQMSAQQEQIHKTTKQSVPYTSAHLNSRIADQEAQIMDLTADCATLQAENARIRADHERAIAELAWLRAAIPRSLGTQSPPYEYSYPVALIKPDPTSRIRNQRQDYDPDLTCPGSCDALRVTRTSSLQHRLSFSGTAQQRHSPDTQSDSTIMEVREQSSDTPAESALLVFDGSLRTKSTEKDKGKGPENPPPLRTGDRCTQEDMGKPYAH